MMKGQEDKKKDIDLFKYKTMLSCCLKCKQNIERVEPKDSATSNGKTMILSNCAIRGSKKSKSIKKTKSKRVIK